MASRQVKVPISSSRSSDDPSLEDGQPLSRDSASNFESAHEKPVVGFSRRGRSFSDSDVLPGIVKVRFGNKAKIAMTTGCLLTILSLIGSSTMNVLQGSKSESQDVIAQLLAQHPILRKQVTGDIERTPSFRVWERSSPQADELPYYDTDLLLKTSLSHDQTKHEIRRSTDSSTIAPVQAQPEANATEASVALKTPSEKTTSGIVIDFKNFACNVIARHWVCSRTGSPFCVFINQAVPSATKVLIKMLPAVPELTPSERRIMLHKCDNKINVLHVDIAF